MLLKLGSKGKDVENLQIALTHFSLGANPLLIDGDFGKGTQSALLDFQQKSGLVADGVYGNNSHAALTAFVKNNGNFTISIHAGHGGLRKDGTYATLPSTGKRYKHKSVELHTKDGWFYEGFENRIAANEAAKQLRAAGIFTLVTHDEIECDYGKLSIHKQKTAPYIEAGYRGFTHAFHSNACSDKIEDKNGKLIRYRTQAEMDNIIGCFVFTTKGNTLSDKFAAIHLRKLQQKFGSWIRLRDNAEIATEKSDAESNFKVIADIEAAAKDYDNPYFGATLQEHGFMTSIYDCQKIINPQVRQMRVAAFVEAVLEARTMVMR